MGKKKIAGLVAAGILLLAVVFVWRFEKKSSEKISVYLWSVSLMEEYAPYIQSQFPEAEIEFVVGNNDLDFYQFLKKNGELPDIITNRRFSLYDAQDLQDQLLDLSSTEQAASYYTTYLENYRNTDGTINWLPLCGEVDGIIANKALFEGYNIPVPTDYNSFVAACRTFEEYGIRGFVSDFMYDYTCLEILQGWSIPEINSLEGKSWRLAYENPADALNGLDTVIWPGVFERMEQFIGDVNLQSEDIQLDYDTVREMFLHGSVAMIRETGAAVIQYSSEESIDPIMLPYFGQNGEEWLLTYPAFQVALNKELEEDDERKELAFRILDVMLSEEGQNILAQKKDVIPYTKNVKLELAPELKNLEPYIDSNYLYIRLASNDFFSVSRDVVQKMITGEYDAGQAYEAFDVQLKQPKEDTQEMLVSFEEAYPYDFSEKGGNPAASAMANTLRNVYGTDLLIAPFYNFTGPVLQADYSEKMAGYMIMPNACVTYIREMTGEEVYELLRVSIEGMGKGFRPFNPSSLPVISGASVQVEEKAGKFTLLSVLIEGKELDPEESYRVAYLNPPNYFEPIAVWLYPDKGPEMFDRQILLVRDAWVEYLKQGGKISEPSDYICIK